MIKHATWTARQVFMGSANTAAAEFFVLAVLCSGIMMFFAHP
jgi:hypothetical protein